MLVSSVYSWLKQIRANFDTYDEHGANRRQQCAHCHQCMPFVCEQPTLRRSMPATSWRNIQRVRKARSAGDAWGLDFQVSTTSDSLPADEEVCQVLRDEFAFLSDVECDMEQPDSNPDEEQVAQTIADEPVYVNIASVVTQPSLSTSCSFVSLATTMSYEDQEDEVRSTSGETYTVDCSATVSISSSLEDVGWTRLRKGHSLDSFIPRMVEVEEEVDKDENEEPVRMRAKEHRRSVIPVVQAVADVRRAIMVEASEYEHIWECISPPAGGDPLRIKHARENVVSFAFDEAMELLPEVAQSAPSTKTVDDRTKGLPTADVVMWLRRLLWHCEWECGENFAADSLDKEIPTGIEAPGKFNESHHLAASTTTSSGEKGVCTTSSQSQTKYDFSNVRKYKIDNQSFKLSKSEVLAVDRGQLLVKSQNGSTRVLADTMHGCTLEMRGSREKVLVLPDRRSIHLFWEKKAANTNQPEGGAAPRSDNVRHRLMQLFKKRPPLADLSQKGIYQNEGVFGNTLAQLEASHASSGGDSVPALVRKCVELVERPPNIDSEGLYRSSASLATLQDLRFAINGRRDAVADLQFLEKYAHAPDVPSGLLKLFIRELKESLIGEDDFKRLLHVTESDVVDSGKQQKAIEIVQSMARPHRDTLELLLVHLNKVIRREAVNGMSMMGIAICWGQTLCSFPDPPDGKILVAKHKNTVTALLLNAYKHYIAPPTTDGAATCVNISPSSHTLDSEAPTPTSSSAPPVDGVTFTKSPVERAHSAALVVPNGARRFFFPSTHPRIYFLGELFARIESLPFKGVYRGRGDERMVDRIVHKSRKPKSKELDKLLRKADVFVLGDVVEHVIREFHRGVTFEDIPHILRHDVGVLNCVPEYVLRLCAHFSCLRSKCANPHEELTLLDDLFQRWWDVLIESPSGERKEEQIGVSMKTFAEITNVLAGHHAPKKWASASDLLMAEAKGSPLSRSTELCCYNGGRRYMARYTPEYKTKN